MIRFILLCALAATPVFAQQQAPMNIEQRLAVQIANLSLQNASLMTQLDQITEENKKLKDELATMKAKK